MRNSIVSSDGPARSSRRIDEAASTLRHLSRLTRVLQVRVASGINAHPQESSRRDTGEVKRAVVRALALADEALDEVLYRPRSATPTTADPPDLTPDVPCTRVGCEAVSLRAGPDR